MKTYKKIIIFSICWVLFFFITEFLMNILFDDKTPLWKILSISLISGFGMFYPFLKKGKDFSLENVKKKQKRSIKINSEISRTNLKEKVVEQLKLKNFKILKADFNKIELKSKWNINTFGEKYVINLNENEITIESMLNLNIFPLDGGIRYEKTNIIEKEIINLC